MIKLAHLIANKYFFVTVNHTSLTSATHDEAINVLRNSGSELILTVKHYKSAAPFLLKNLRQFIPETEQIFPGIFRFIEN